VRPADVVRRAAGYLDRHDVQSPLPTAEILMADILGTDRTGVYARTAGLTSQEARRFGRALCRRCSGTPLQHITGRQAFRRLTLEVRPGVFIPRPETEVLVGAGLSAISDRARPVVVDVGTGSGAVALAIADEHRGARVLATDRSPEALVLAADNAARLGLDIEILAGDLLAPVPPELRGRLDLVVSNPPYVDPASAGDLPADVRADPPVALFGTTGITGRVLGEAASWLAAGGTVAVEIDESTAAEVGEAARRAGFDRVRVLPDLAGRDRVVTAVRR
jgi:release factor glutamine methyltransferase